MIIWLLYLWHCNLCKTKLINHRQRYLPCLNGTSHEKVCCALVGVVILLAHNPLCDLFCPYIHGRFTVSGTWSTRELTLKDMGKIDCYPTITKDNKAQALRTYCMLWIRTSTLQATNNHCSHSPTPRFPHQRFLQMVRQLNCVHR